MTEYTNEAGEAQDAEDYEERINKYARRFTSVFLNIHNKEQQERKLLLEAMNRALIVETVAHELDCAGRFNLTPQQVHERLSSYVSAYGNALSDNFNGQFDRLVEAAKAAAGELLDDDGETTDDA